MQQFTAEIMDGCLTVTLFCDEYDAGAMAGIKPSHSSTPVVGRPVANGG